MADDKSASCLLVVRVAPEQESIRYRAYAERLGARSVLDWALSRFIAAAPRHVGVICVCDREDERTRLQAACTLSSVRVLNVAAETEAHLCRRIMDDHQVQRLIVVRLRHAIAPVFLIPSMLAVHQTHPSGLTDAPLPSAATKPMFVIDSLTVDALLVAASLGISALDIMAAVALVREFRQANVRSPLPTVVSQQIDVPRLSRMPSSQWPEMVGMHSARDVETLRGALAYMAANGLTSDRDLIRAWKYSAIALAPLTLSPDPSPAARRRKRATGARRARILYATGVSTLVGAAQSLCHLIDGLDRHSYDPVALVAYDGVLTDELRRRRVPVICPNANFLHSTADNIRFAHAVIRNIAPDIVHANHAVGLPLTSATMQRPTWFVQHVRTQTLDDLSLGIHAADAVITVSDFVRQQVVSLDVDPVKVHTILNGVNSTLRPDRDRRPVCRALLGVPQDEFVIAVIGRFVRYKRHEIVIRAVGQMRRRAGRGHVILVGTLDSDRAYYHELCAEVDRQGLIPHTTRIAFTPHISDVLHASDTLALLSRGEALGRVVLEAMAVGLPVVVGDIGGNREVIDHRHNGFVVPDGNVVAVAEALHEMANNPHLTAAMGTAAADLVRTTLSADRCAEHTMALYERLLQRHAGIDGLTSRSTTRGYGTARSDPNGQGSR